jgi:DNA-binding MarR family transcriptional regulator
MPENMDFFACWAVVMDNRHAVSTSRRNPVLYQAEKMRKKAGSTRKKKPAESTHTLDTGHLHQTIAYHIRRAQLQLWRDFKENVNTGIMVRGQYTVMSMIDANPGITQVDLSRMLDIDKAALVSLVFRLEKSGWLAKKPAEEDRRRHTLFLTKSGRNKLNKLNESMTAEEDAIRSKFTKAEVSTLIQLLRRIYE